MKNVVSKIYSAWVLFSYFTVRPYISDIIFFNRVVVIHSFLQKMLSSEKWLLSGIFLYFLKLYTIDNIWYKFQITTIIFSVFKRVDAQRVTTYIKTARENRI